jgi:hypothetical protein
MDDATWDPSFEDTSRNRSRSPRPRRSSQRRDQSSAASGANHRAARPQSSAASGANHRAARPQSSAASGANCEESRPLLRQFSNDAISAQRREDLITLGVDVMTYVNQYCDALMEPEPPRKKNGDPMPLWHFVSNAFLRDHIDGGKALFDLISDGWKNCGTIPLALICMGSEDITRTESSSQRRSRRQRYSTDMHPCDEKQYESVIWQIRGDLAYYQGEVRTWSLQPERWYRLDRSLRVGESSSQRRIASRQLPQHNSFDLGMSNYQFKILDYDPYYKAILCQPNFFRPLSSIAVEDVQEKFICIRSVKCTTFGELFWAACDDFPYSQIIRTWEEGRIVLSARQGGSNRKNRG